MTLDQVNTKVFDGIRDRLRNARSASGFARQPLVPFRPAPGSAERTGAPMVGH